MNHQLLGSLCSRLLLTHSKVALPGLGCLLAEDQPSYLSRDGHILMPPSRRVYFRAQVQGDPELLARTLAEEKQLPLEEAAARIAEEMQALQSRLAKSKNEELPPLGRLRRTQEGQVFFVASKHPGLAPEGFGLVPLAVSPVGAEIEEAQGTEEGKVGKENGDKENGGKENGGKEEKAAGKEDKWADAKDTETYFVYDLPELEDREAWERRQKRQKLRIVAAVIVLVLLIIFCLGYLFRHELRPFYEWLLYNAEDRSFLRSLPGY